MDEEWLELVQDEVQTALKDTFLAGAPMVPVSSVTGRGIPELTSTLERLAEEVETRPVVGPWRLPVDRAFTVGGFGTVVTGTLMSGTVRVGDRVEILPRGWRRACAASRRTVRARRRRRPARASP